MHAFYDNITIASVESVFTVSTPKKNTARIVERKNYGLAVCTEGRLVYEMNGERFVSDAGTAVILPQGKSYTVYGEKKSFSWVVDFTCVRPFTEKHTIIALSDTGSYERTFKKMLSLFLLGGKRLKLMSLLYSVLHSVLGAQPSVIDAALKHIEESYGDSQLSNSTLAAVCSISEVYFRKLFLRNLGTTPRQFLIDFRLNKAKQLLSEGTLKITAVSEKCGFSSPYHFCRTFRRQVGVTPTEYMLLHKNDGI